MITLRLYEKYYTITMTTKTARGFLVGFCVGLLDGPGIHEW